MQESAIINISSGFAFSPLAVVPVYCATKAATGVLSKSENDNQSATEYEKFGNLDFNIKSPELVRSTVNDN